MQPLPEQTSRMLRERFCFNECGLCLPPLKTGVKSGGERCSSKEPSLRREARCEVYASVSGLLISMSILITC